MNSNYQPIDCNYYDILLAHATKRAIVEIEYETEIGNSIKISETIKNVYTKNGEEFMLLANGESVRLDKILSVDGVIRANFGGGKSCGIG